MPYSCPLDFTRVDSYASRIASFIVASLVTIYLLSSNQYILFYLVLDFGIKIFINKDYSPIGKLSKLLRKSLRVKENFTDGGAKKLAAIFGLIFVSLLLITHYLAWTELMYIVAGVFLACSLLDVFVNYCLGCQIYFIIKKMYPSFMS